MNKQERGTRFEALSRMLLAERNPDGYWDGRLSSSALGVAVACAALHAENAGENRDAIVRGMKWLSANVNADGGFGDTPESQSNISTSLLCYASVYQNRDFFADSSVLLEAVAAYLLSQNIDLRSGNAAQAILQHYKTDYTFSVPILTMSALCGISGENGFDKIPQLPFELSLLPRSFYRMLNLSVVSYAIPALVAVGIAIFRHKRKRNGLLRMLRRWAIPRSIQLLEKMMPESGGFLEAIPLTAFVSLCLIESGFRDSVVVQQGVAFLKRTQREDGSWPIDVDLSTWVSTLAVKSLRGDLVDTLGESSVSAVANHFVKIQNKQVHPFNGTSPGGWGWTHFSGSVPDCDDTPGVILALLKIQEQTGKSYLAEAVAACDWLLRLQNSDGGFPTFARGWGKLPFDQSCADLTGHAVLAFAQLIEVAGVDLSSSKRKKYERTVERGLNYLLRKQRSDGSLLPLWFGNQLTADHTNPVYGTARVVAYLNDVLACGWVSVSVRENLTKLVDDGAAYLWSVQNADGSWGGAKNISGTIEETSLAISALVDSLPDERIAKAFGWLEQQCQSSGLVASPIGLYFASLWYDERMYPLTMYLEAVCRAKEKAGIVL